MRTRALVGLVASMATVVAVVTAAAPAHAAAPGLDPAVLAVARATLAQNDGWASSGNGTTGGSAADGAHVFVVHNRTELVDALGPDNATNGSNATPKIVLVDGVIEGNATDDGSGVFSCDDYAVGTGYSLAAYLDEAKARSAKPDPSDPSQPQETARAAAAAKQAARMMINVGSNTTILGLKGAKLIHANLMIGSFAGPTINRVSNVIVRNLTFADAADCFPAWDPTDGSKGNWNSAYDTVSIIGGVNVWIDHNEFSDGANVDTKQPVYVGRPYQVHDGFLDITREADKVTVSYNYLHDHDKTMLIGGSDTPTGYSDADKLRVTLHHNVFANLGQRIPRVRFGKLDIYNNHFITGPSKGPFANDGYGYALGAGVGSRIYAEKNFVNRAADVKLGDIVKNWRKDKLAEPGITDKDTLVATGSGQPLPTDLVKEYNTAHASTALSPSDWTPTLRAATLTPTADVPTVVDAAAGVGKLWIDLPPDGATQPPAQGVLSNTSGWKTGLRDGNYDVSLNMWWGANASLFVLYENGVEIARRDLSPSTPGAQHATIAISGRPNGAYVYTGELLNQAGRTATTSTTVTVTDANPAKPALSADNWDSDDNYAVTMNLWWGTNATTYRLYEDGVLVDLKPLTAATPGAQSQRTPLTGRAVGAHTYVAELANAAGVTRSDALEVTVGHPSPPSPPPTGPIGFGEGTTGGAGGPTVTVTTFADLVTEAKAKTPKIILVSGILQGSGAEEFYVTSNKSIIGVGDNSGITGGGLFIKKADNVIIQNLKIFKSLAPTDLIQIQASTHVWIDHNELYSDTDHDKDYYDGMLDINHGSDFVTVSWNNMHDHFKGSLVGHSDKNTAEDSGHLRVTYHHNWLHNVESRLPRLRFGTVHAFNNLYEDAATSGIHCLMGSQCLAQNNVFRNVNLPIWTTEDSPLDGYAFESGNDFGGHAPVITQTSAFTYPPYAVTLDPTSSVAAQVQGGAGVGKIG
jgi:pectate lyase